MRRAFKRAMAAVVLITDEMLARFKDPKNKFERHSVGIAGQTRHSRRSSRPSRAMLCGCSSQTGRNSDANPVDTTAAGASFLLPLPARPARSPLCFLPFSIASWN